MKTVISIIIASYNKAAHIGQTITSVLQQNFKNWELIIVDDCSTDDTRTVLEKVPLDFRIRFLFLKTNRGANHCRNIGLKQAQGDYVIFLDADDLLAPFCLSSRYNATAKFAKANLFVFSMSVFYKTPGDDNRTWIPRTRKPLRDFLRHKLPWSILQPLWKKDMLLELGGFDESFKRLQDVELNTRALLNNNLRLQIIGGTPDCYYRIDEARKNFDAFTFMQHWVNACLAYCNKFTLLVKFSERNFLYGTLYETYLQLMYQFKNKTISTSEFQLLEQQLLNFPQMPVRAAKKVLFGLARLNNLGSFKIPGLNTIIGRLFVV